MYETYDQSILGKTAEDGPQIAPNTGYEGHSKHQICIELAGPPSAGSMKIEIQHPGSSSWMEISGSPIDISGLNHEISKIVSLEAFVGSFRFTPTQDLNVAYNIYIKTVK